MIELLYAFYSLVLYLFLFGAIFACAEKIRPVQKDVGFFKNDFKVEVSYILFNFFITGRFLAAILALSVIDLAQDYLPNQVFDEFITKIPVFMQVILSLILLDLILYARHSFFHHYMWKYHSVHHLPDEINWITSQRLHPIESILDGIFRYLMLYILGFSGESLATAAFFMSLWNMFTHANIDIEFPKPLRYIISSPNYHRWHHAKEKEAINKNFTVVFPFIDIIFGTYYYPEKSLPKEYGFTVSDNDKPVPKTFIKQILYPFRK